MENRAEEKSTSFSILRFVKITRIILFGCTIGLQAYFAFVLGSVYYLSSIAPISFVILADLMMVNKRKDQFKEFYLVSVIICLIALGIITVAFFPLLLFPYISDFYEALFFLLGFGVMIVSFIELFTLIYLTRPQEDYKEKVWDDKEEVWEKKKDTIDIQ